MRVDLDNLVHARGTVRTVASAINVPYETLRDWITGRRSPPAYVLNAAVSSIRRLPILSDDELQRMHRPGPKRAA
jgi:hypothetical protein